MQGRLRLGKALVLFALLSGVSGHGELWNKWNAIAKKYGEWGKGINHERRGQICDPWREFGDSNADLEDKHDGCTVIFLSERGDEWEVNTLPRNQQDNFLNTQHYNSAWNLHGKGMKGDSLPRAPQDLNPSCYIVNVSGTVALGYEEGNGDKLLPCPGARDGYPLTEEEILDPNANLEELCQMCYQAVCTGNGGTNPQNCGGSNQGGVDVGAGNGQVADMIEQVNTAYHCHLAIGNDGACDYVQYDQHEESREYYMDYGVLCGWKNIKYLNITHCDCTLEDGTDNNCQRQQCLDMALTGVICGNCGGCDQNRAREQIFTPKEIGDKWAGSCALAETATTQEGRNYNSMLCSQGLFCRGTNQGSGCDFHCSIYGPNSHIYADPKCVPDHPLEGVEVADVQTGFQAKFYFLANNENPRTMPDVSTREPSAEVIAADIDYGNANSFRQKTGLENFPNDRVAGVWSGYIHIDQEGEYDFCSSSDDGSHVWIDGYHIVDNGGLHGRQERCGEVNLQSGYHEFHAYFFEVAGQESMTVRYRGADTNNQKRVIPGFHQGDGPGRRLLGNLGTLEAAAPEELTLTSRIEKDFIMGKYPVIHAKRRV
mmetsp:Transcript_458/g.803  ORF Transcript_458/g.803 Transcript_458/m.803 type:complete len:598 (-) Transcript_458:150-1943(-)